MATLRTGFTVGLGTGFVATLGFGTTGFGTTGFGTTGFGATGFGATGFGAIGFGITGFGLTTGFLLAATGLPAPFWAVIIS